MLKKLLIFMLLPLWVSAQRQSGGISITLQTNYKGGGDTTKYQDYNPINSAWTFRPRLSGGNNFVNGLNTFEAQGAGMYGLRIFKNGTTIPIIDFAQNGTNGGLLLLRDNTGSLNTQISGNGVSSFSYPVYFNTPSAVYEPIRIADSTIYTSRTVSKISVTAGASNPVTVTYSTYNSTYGDNPNVVFYELVSAGVYRKRTDVQPTFNKTGTTINTIQFDFGIVPNGYILITH